jgi:L-ascorbate metabolism protein UlaG (beta-lactamase superfamily)
MMMTRNDSFETDVLPTSAGEVVLTFLGHGSLRFTFAGKEIYVDPFGEVADFSKLPKADVILITHEHYDHCDPKAVEAVRQNTTQLVAAAACRSMLAAGNLLQNGDSCTVDGLPIQAVPAYNRVHKHGNGQLFHKPGEGNGYILVFGNQRVYIAGDTENIPEMRNLQNIGVAFLPVNVPYTMTPEMAADAARMIRPRILYPYHFGDTDLSRLVDLLKDEKGIEVRIRRMA